MNFSDAKQKRYQQKHKLQEDATAGMCKAWERKEQKMSLQVNIFDAQAGLLVKILVSSPR